MRSDVLGPEEFGELFGSRGISNEHTIVLYGDRNNWFAAYTYWYLKYYGHDDVKLVNGPREKWISEGRPTTSEVPDYPATTFTAQAGNGADNHLAGEWFADTGFVLGDKDSLQMLQGRWLYEISELDAMARAEVTKIKAFVASKSDWYRASFDKRPREYPRQLVFAGTTNEHQYLVDGTGNRRFWPVDVTRVIDTEWVQIALGRAHARIEALTLVNWKLAADADHGVALSPAEASATKIYGSELATEVYRSLMEVVGPHAGITGDSPGAALAGRLERFHRSSLVMTFGGGTNEIQRDIIGYIGLGLPAAKR